MLLEITPITKSDDVHDVVGRVQEKAQQIIKNELKLESKAIVGFTMTLSEVCQNIIEHAGQRRLGGGAELSLDETPRPARGRDRRVRRGTRLPPLAGERARASPPSTAGTTPRRSRRR